jgi:hypothetical protein
MKRDFGVEVKVIFGIAFRNRFSNRVSSGLITGVGGEGVQLLPQAGYHGGWRHGYKIGKNVVSYHDIML